MKNNSNLFIFLCVSFICAILLRYDQINKTIGCEEQTHILTLQTVEIWRQHGFIKSHLTPMWTYENQGDKFFAYYKRLEDKSGNNYYVSFPPLAFWTAYIVMAPFSIENGKIVLQIVNSFIHFLSALLVLLIVLSSFQNKNFKKIPIEATLAFLIYLFVPVNMYLHTHIFFPEMLSQLLFLSVLYYTIIIYKHPEKIKLLKLRFGLIMFLFVMTEWIALFFAFVLLLLLLKKRKTHGALLNPLIVGVLSALLCIFTIYASIDGVQSLGHAMGVRFLERSGFFGEKYSSVGISISSAHGVKIMLGNIHKAMWGWGYIIIFAGFTAIIFARKNMIKVLQEQKVLLFLTFLPVLIYMTVLFNANALHFLLMARLALPLSFIAAILCNTFINNRPQKTVFLLLMLCGLSLSIYDFKTNMKIQINSNEADYLAAHINTHAEKEASVFVISDMGCNELEKYLTFKSKRNIIKVWNIQQADSLSNVLGKDKSIVFVHHFGKAEIEVFSVFSKFSP